MLGAAEMARKAGADLLIFVRDRDRDRRREKDILQAIAKVKDLQVVGGVAVESIEAWVFAICGDHAAETYSQPKQHLPRHGIQCAADMVDRIREAGTAATATATAPSLRQWLDKLEAVWAPKP